MLRVENTMLAAFGLTSFGPRNNSNEVSAKLILQLI